MSGSPWPRAAVAGAAVVLLGYGIMRGTTPSDKQFYDSLSPDLRRQVDNQRLAAERKAAYREQLMRAKEGADSGPVWAEAEKGRDSSPPPKLN